MLSGVKRPTINEMELRRNDMVYGFRIELKHDSQWGRSSRAFSVREFYCRARVFINLNTETDTYNFSYPNIVRAPRFQTLPIAACYNPLPTFLAI